MRRFWTSPWLARRPLLACALACALAGVLLSAAPARAIPDGFYVSLGLGGAVVSGQRGVAFIPRGGRLATHPGTGGAFLCDDTSGPGSQCIYAASKRQFREASRTQFGGGLAFQLRLGYNFLGYVAPELSLAGHGSTDGKSGAGYVGLDVRYHFIEHFIAHQDRRWDVNAYAGLGFAMGGYSYPDPQPGDPGHTLGKGWQGFSYDVGLGFDWTLSKSVAIGLDLKLVIPRYLLWIADFGKGYHRTPIHTPSTIVFMPTVQVTFFP